MCVSVCAHAWLCVTGEEWDKGVARVVVERQQGGEARKEWQHWVSEMHLQLKTRFGIMKM